LNEALTIMQQHSINRHIIEWDGLRISVYALARGARTPADTYPAIRYALTLLYDLHSDFFSPSEAAKLRAGTLNVPSLEPRGELVATNLGYVVVPSFLVLSMVDDKSTAFATNIQQIIATLDAHAPCAWIVDLRENQGAMYGRCWLELGRSWAKAGSGPLLILMGSRRSYPIGTASHCSTM
jgi:hypothetical protein